MPILRAGLGIAEHLFRIIPSAKVQHLGMYSDEKTLKKIEIIKKQDPTRTFYLYLDLKQLDLN